MVCDLSKLSLFFQTAFARASVTNIVSTLIAVFIFVANMATFTCIIFRQFRHFYLLIDQKLNLQFCIRLQVFVVRLDVVDLI